jgi:putative transposase
VPHDVRDQVLDFVRRWSEKTAISAGRFIAWLGATASKFYNRRERHGRTNEHNGWVPRDFWLEGGRKKRSSVSICRIHWKVIVDLHS